MKCSKCSDPECTQPVPTQSPIERLEDAQADLLAAQGVVGCSIDGRSPGVSDLSIQPNENYRRGIVLIGRNDGDDGALRFYIDTPDEAWWLAEQLQRIYGPRKATPPDEEIQF